MNDGISVIIPTYNRADMLPTAVRSVLAAIQPGDEILVIDDESTDNTEELMRAFGEPVRYHRIPNGGPGTARNTGIRLARHDLLAFLDSDDEYYPDRLFLQRQVMQKYPHLVFSFGNISNRCPDGTLRPDLLSVFRTHENIGSPFAKKEVRELLGPAIPFSSIGELPAGTPDFNVHIGDIYKEMTEFLCAHGNTVLVRRSNAGSACHFPEDVRLMEDWEFLIALARQGPVAYLDRDIAIFTEHYGPRLSSVYSLGQMTARLRLLNRACLKKDGTPGGVSEFHDALVRFYHAKRGMILFHMEKLEEARADFDAAGGPAVYRFFTHLPASVALPLYRTQLQFKKLIKSAIGRSTPVSG